MEVANLNCYKDFGTVIRISEAFMMSSRIDGWRPPISKSKRHVVRLERELLSEESSTPSFEIVTLGMGARLA